MKRLLSYSVISILFLQALFVPISQAASFSDVPNNAWFFNDVEEMTELGVIRGNSDGTFTPNRNVNRAELSAMLVRYNEHLKKRIEDLEEKLLDCAIDPGSESETLAPPSTISVNKFNRLESEVAKLNENMNKIFKAFNEVTRILDNIHLGFQEVTGAIYMPILNHLIPKMSD